MSEDSKTNAYDQAVNIAVMNLIDFRIAQVLQMINRDVDEAKKKGLSLFNVHLVHGVNDGSSIMCSFGPLDQENK